MKRPPKRSQTGSPGKKKVPIELKTLEIVVGQFMEYWGFKKIHGRIWAHVFTSAVPLDSTELMERLGVSKGLMSLAIRDLVHYRVIEADHVGKHGTTFYRANPRLIEVISNVLKERESAIIASATDACDGLQQMGQSKLQEYSLSKERIAQVSELTASAQFLLQAFLAQSSEQSDALEFFHSRPS